MAALPALMAARAALCAAGCEQQAVLEPGQRRTRRRAPRTPGASSTRSPPCRRPSPDAAFRAACGLPPAPLPRRPAAAGRSRRARRGARPGSSTSRRAPTRSRPAPGATRPRSRRRGAGPAARRGGRGRPPRRGAHRARPGRGLDEPATVHLGVDVFLPAGTAVLAPAGRPGRCGAARASSLLARRRRRWRCGSPALVAGGENAGDGESRRGEVASGTRGARPAPGERLPAHVHVQLGRRRTLDELPGLVPASLAPAWLAVCPDPGPLLGLDAGRRRRAGRTPSWPAAGAPSPARSACTSPTPRRRSSAAGGSGSTTSTAGPTSTWSTTSRCSATPTRHVEAAASRQLRRLNTNSRFLYDALGRFAERLAGAGARPARGRLLRQHAAARRSTSRCGSRARPPAGATSSASRAPTTAGPAATDETVQGAAVGAPDRSAAPRPRALARPAARRRSSAARRRRCCASRCSATGAACCCPTAGSPRPTRSSARPAGCASPTRCRSATAAPGSHFWAFEQQGVVPDLVTLAKPAGNGHPLGAVIATRAIADALRRARGPLLLARRQSRLLRDRARGARRASSARACRRTPARVGEHLTAPARAAGRRVRARGRAARRRASTAGSSSPAPTAAGGAEALAVCERLLGSASSSSPPGRT